ncbi:MAG: SDR family oxidoreductase [Flavobacteriaceae bacterium]|jgi:3-oxoacyl-[acyl-carrier protein] reductase
MKNILITGVSRGLGLEITKVVLKNNDYCVYGVSRSKTDEIEELLVNYPDRFHWMFYDLSNLDDIRNKIFKEFIKMKTPIHGYVNNAAVSYDDIVTNINYDPLLNMYKINVFNPMITTKYVLRQFLLHNIKGSIVHISSISVHTGYKGLAMYASTKGALEAFSKNTAREWGERGIRSNALVAGFMETDMSSTLSENQKNRIYKRNSMKIPTTTKSVAETVLFLLSEASESITGQSIHVDSGTI